MINEFALKSSPLTETNFYVIMGIPSEPPHDYFLT